jgi:hypothetical protein
MIQTLKGTLRNYIRGSSSPAANACGRNKHYVTSAGFGGVSAMHVDVRVRVRTLATCFRCPSVCVCALKQAHASTQDTEMDAR